MGKELIPKKLKENIENHLILTAQKRTLNPLEIHSNNLTITPWGVDGNVIGSFNTGFIVRAAHAANTLSVGSSF
jgi:hypothetical protein